MRTAHLFAGGGGGLLADFLLGHTPVLAIERDPRRCALLRDRYPGLAVAEGDVRGMDFTQWHGRVDALHAGVPCPKWSNARRGVGDPPDLTSEVLRVVAEIRPGFVFLECVPGFIAEYPHMRADFQALGFTLAAPLLLSAADVGAPHHRERVWIAGYADENGEPVVPVHAEVAVLPEPDSSPWEIGGVLPVADGLADHWEMECAGDGQVPLQAAVAWRLLGGP